MLVDLAQQMDGRGEEIGLLRPHRVCADAALNRAVPLSEFPAETPAARRQAVTAPSRLR